MTRYRLRPRLNGRNILIAFLSAVVITLVLVFLTGLESHRSILNNALISLSILAGLIFIFLSLGLYYAVRVEDDLTGKFKLKWVRSDFIPDGFGNADLADGCGEDIGAVILWIVVTILSILLIIFLGTLLWAGFIIVVGAIYWVMIRALRAILRKSHLTHGHLLKSLGYAFMYTTLYIGWIYGIIFIAMELKK